jgi:L-asparaginase II
MGIEREDTRRAAVRPKGEQLAVSTRGDWTEYVHAGHAAVVDSDGRLIAWAGDPGWMTLLRAMAMPVQAVHVLLAGLRESDAYDDRTVAALAGMLTDDDDRAAVAEELSASTGVPEEALYPHDRHERKHAHPCAAIHVGILAVCKQYNLPLAGYTKPDHPVQRELLRRMAEFAGIGEGAVGRVRDGCGLPGYAMPLWRLALVYARLAAPPEDWADAPARKTAARVAGAAAAAGIAAASGPCPLLTLPELLREQGVFAASGAPGTLALALPRHRLGIAVKLCGDSDTAMPAIVAGMLDDIAAMFGEAKPQSAQPVAALAQRIRERFPEVRLGDAGETIGRHEPAARLIFAGGIKL